MTGQRWILVSEASSLLERHERATTALQQALYQSWLRSKQKRKRQHNTQQRRTKTKSNAANTVFKKFVVIISFHIENVSTMRCCNL